jgi:hypothetical protein
MGWCHEFGIQICAGCGQPMVAGASSCHCDACGTECPGRFAGCRDVWARGPRRDARPRRAPPGAARRHIPVAQPNAAAAAPADADPGLEGRRVVDDMLAAALAVLSQRVEELAAALANQQRTIADLGRQQAVLVKQVRLAGQEVVSAGTREQRVLNHVEQLALQLEDSFEELGRSLDALRARVDAATAAGAGSLAPVVELDRPASPGAARNHP